MAIWAVKEKLDGKFFWVTYEDSREQFSTIRIDKVDRNKGITEFQRKDLTYKEFKEWYNELNNKPGKLW